MFQEGYEDGLLVDHKDIQELIDILELNSYGGLVNIILGLFFVLEAQVFLR